MVNINILKFNNGTLEINELFTNSCRPESDEDITKRAEERFTELVNELFPGDIGGEELKNALDEGHYNIDSAEIFITWPIIR